MSVQNPVPQTPTAPQPEPNVKKPLAFAALAVAVVSSIILIASHVITMRQALADFSAADSAGDTLVICVVIAAVLYLVGLILGLIALIKSKPKTLPLIIFIVVVVLPVIALFVGRAIQDSMISSALS